MADIQKSVVDILASMPVGTVAGTSVQDIRDFITSLKSSHGKLSIGTPADTTIAVAGTYYKLAGSTVFGADFFQFDSPVSNRLRYTGSVELHFHIVSQASIVNVAGTNKSLSIKLAKNGVVMDDTISNSLFKSAGDELTMVSHGDIHLAPNDYIELFCTNNTNTTAVRMNNCYMFGMSMFGL